MQVDKRHLIRWFVFFIPRQAINSVPLSRAVAFYTQQSLKLSPSASVSR